MARWTPAPGLWSIAECLDHLAVTNQVYLNAMQQAAVRARSKGRVRRGAAVPGLVGGWFASQLEPPVKAGRKFKSTRNIQPRPSPLLADAYGDFVLAQQRVRQFIRENADLDLAGVRFANPIIRGLRFSLASGLFIILAHERRHLWQARQVLRVYGESRKP